jgi:hypothetical protein
MKCLVFTLIYIPLGIFAQISEFHYSYDAAGNRVVREIPSPKPNNPQGSTMNTVAYEDEINGLQISLYPNPTQDEVIIEAKGGEIFAEHVRIIDSRGAVLLHLQKQNLPLQLHFGTYPAGIYSISMQVGEEVKRYKILVAR